MFFPHPGGFALVGAVLTDILAGLAFIIVVAIVVAVLVVFVRFLLAATKAAELYVANNTKKDGPTTEGTPATPRARAPKPPTT